MKSIKTPAKKAKNKGSFPFWKKFKTKIKIKIGHWPKKNTPMEGKKIWPIIAKKNKEATIILFDNKDITP